MLSGNRSLMRSHSRFTHSQVRSLVERFPDNTISRLLGGVTTLSRPEQAADVEAFLADHPVPQAVKTIEQHLERLRVNVALREREAVRVAAHLS